MSIPEYQTFMRPLLAFRADGQEKNIRDAIKAIADKLHLSPDDRQLLVPSGKQTLLDNRVHWARTYPDKAGALKRTRRSHFVVTDRGRELLKQHPDRIDAQVLQQFPEFLVFKNTKAQANGSEGAAQSEDQTLPELSSATPEDMLQTAEAAIAEKLSTQLLERIQELSPAFFERLVVDLIVAMGYGGSRDSVVQKLGKRGDQGIDGVVNEDPLGLDVVYVQAKRYAPDNTVGRERIQQFAGALVGSRCLKGRLRHYEFVHERRCAVCPAGATTDHIDRWVRFDPANDTIWRWRSDGEDRRGETP